MVWALVAFWALWTLEGARQGIAITQHSVGGTPVWTYSDGADGPDVVVAHGFAGSALMMQSYALALAQAGYTVHAFDFLGHGRHQTPMSGDVTTVDGTTRLLMEQTQAVVAETAAGRAALLGHSMATDVLIRAADPARTDPVILLSAFSQAVTPTHPASMLLLVGAGEGRLVPFATHSVAQVDPGTAPGDTAVNGAVSRRAVVLPWIEHVSILHSQRGRDEAVAWLNAHYDRNRTAAPAATGPALLALLFAVVALVAPLARRLGRSDPVTTLTNGQFWAVALLPAVAAPVIAVSFHTPLLPVLVADYLALHFLLLGGAQLLMLRMWGVEWGRLRADGIALLLVWGLGVFGLLLNRYGANYLPTTDRAWIVAVMAWGTVPFMLADARLTVGAPLWQLLVARAAVLASLGLAVALDFEGLFFLLLIAPVILLFYLVYGTMGRMVARRTGPLASGVGLGLLLAWALGVSFPLFVA